MVYELVNRWSRGAGEKSGINIFRVMERGFMTEKPKKDVPIWEKQNLTIKEAAAYSGIGENTIRSLLKSKNCPFLLKVGNKSMVKKKKFDDYIEKINGI